MKIRKVGLTPFRLPLRAALVTSAQRIEYREGVLVSVHLNAALVGFGEATPLAGFGMETASETWDALLALAPQLVGEDVQDLGALLDGIERAAPAAPAARAAIDCALHDASARSMARSLAGWLAARAGRRARELVAVNALLVSQAPVLLAAEAAGAAARGYGTLKLKVATGSPTEDAARVAAVRAAVGPDVRLRLDANGGWKEEEALAALELLAAFDVEFIEQPVEAEDVEALARVRTVSPVRVAADEAAAGPERAARVIALRAADVLCLKLGPCGGLRAALRLAERARSVGIEVFVTTALDGGIGRTAALQLAAALPTPFLACGLATAGLLADDIASAEEPRQGRMALPAGPGLGLSPDPAALARVGAGPSLEFGEGAS